MKGTVANLCTENNKIYLWTFLKNKDKTFGFSYTWMKNSQLFGQLAVENVDTLNQQYIWIK